MVFHLLTILLAALTSSSLLEEHGVVARDSSELVKPKSALLALKYEEVKKLQHIHWSCPPRTAIGEKLYRKLT